MSAKKVISRDANGDVDKVCIDVQKNYTRFLTSFNTTFSALNYALDFGN